VGLDFESGQKVTRTVGLFNDTRYADPMTFTWKLMVAGKQVATGTGAHNVAPGTNKKFDIVVPMPQVRARTEGQLLLTLSVANKEVFRDTKAVSILPAPSFGASAAPPAAGRPAAPARTSMHGPHTISRSDEALDQRAFGLVVFDPQGNVAAYLKSRGVAFTTINSLETLPAGGKYLWLARTPSAKATAPTPAWRRMRQQAALYRAGAEEPAQVRRASSRDGAF
jgi:beta-galactosidase